jgi:hypothetical protein
MHFLLAILAPLRVCNTHLVYLSKIFPFRREIAVIDMDSILSGLVQEIIIVGEAAIIFAVARRG